MSGTLKVGRLFGIDISLHWSWAFIFVLVTWTFATTLSPDWPAAQRWLVGSGVALIFFASILLHEISHSLVARRYGLPVTSITLFVLGGVSNLGEEPKTASQEFWMAIAGPFTSYALAVAFGTGYVVFHGFAPGVADVSLNLAAVNAAIGTFNLVPGFPMDGGRVLRSIFWARERDVVEATRLASRIGEFIAYTMMGIGFLAFLSVDVISGLWLFIIGLFLRSVSAQSYQQVFVEKVLKGVPASLIVKRDYTPVAPGQTLQELVDAYFLAGSRRCLPVMEGDDLLGLLSLSDVRKAPRDRWPATTAERAMTPFDHIKTVAPGDDLVKVLALMGSADLNQIPMVEGRKLRGMIERSDLIAYIQARETFATTEPTDRKAA